jgi:hypothetical protein
MERVWWCVWGEILKLNHLLLNELFKWRETHGLGVVEDHMLFSSVIGKEMCYYMIWVSSAMDGNKQMGKWLVIECKALKWAKTNNALRRDHLDESSWQMVWLWHHIHDYDDHKTNEIQMHKMHKQRGWVIWCPYLLHEVLEIWPFLTMNWRRLPCLIEEQPSQGESLGCT